MHAAHIYSTACNFKVVVVAYRSTTSILIISVYNNIVLENLNGLVSVYMLNPDSIIAKDSYIASHITQAITNKLT